MRILVTGAAGFIGGALARALAAAGHQVTTLDMRRAEPSIAGTVEIVGDICDRTIVDDAFARSVPEILIHLAARTDLEETRNIDGYRANTTGVDNLLRAVAATPSVERAIWTSSQLVCRVGHVPKDDLEFCPHTLYGESKVRTEQAVRAADGGGRTWCIVRPTTVWGPGMSPHYQRFLGMIQRGHYFHVGKAPLLKSYAYIDNIVHQYMRIAAADAQSVHRRVLYLADYEPIDLRAWCDGFQRAFGSRPIVSLPLPAARLLATAGDAIQAVGVKRVPFNTFRLTNVLTQYVFDLRPTEAICGPLPVSIPEGIERTARWYQNLAQASSGR